MEKINTFWTRIVAATDSADEHRAVQELHEYLKKEPLSFEAFFEKGNGRLVSLQDPAVNIEASSDPVTIRFYTSKNGEPVVKKDWKPKDINNAYYLYHE